jgi:hypothetical protein
LTLRSISGRQHGDPNAASKFGDTLVALLSDHTPIGFFSALFEEKDPPVSLEDMMVENYPNTRKVEYTSHHQ